MEALKGTMTNTDSKSTQAQPLHQPDSAEKPESNVLLNLLVWTVIILLIYFGADLIDKGRILNELTPYPIFGYVMWALVAFVIWFFLLDPIVQFWMLRRAQHANPEKQAKRALRKLRRHRKETDTPLGALYSDILFHLTTPDLTQEQRRTKLLALMGEYRDATGLSGKARQLITSYCRTAALGVVVSRNSLLDGLILLILQMKLIVSLAQLHGYKASPVFNSLCFGWVLTNSFTMALIGQGTAQEVGNMLGDEFADYVSDLLGSGDQIALLGADAMGTRYLQRTIGALIEAVMGATVVYVTGHIFLHRLESDGRKLTLKALFELRREARLTIGKEMLIKLPANLVKNGAKGAAELSAEGVRHLAHSTIETSQSAVKRAQSFFSGLCHPHRDKSTSNAPGTTVPNSPGDSE